MTYNPHLSRRLKTFVLTACAALFCVPLTGCPSQQNVSNLITIVGQSITSIVSIQGNTQLAGQLSTAFAAASTAVANWKQGTPSEEVVQTLNVVQADLALVPVDPVTKVYVELAITTIDTIVTLAAPAASPANHVARGADAGQSATLSTKGLITPEQYKAQFNALVAQSPRYAGAAIR